MMMLVLLWIEYLMIIILISLFVSHRLDFKEEGFLDGSIFVCYQVLLAITSKNILRFWFFQLSLIITSQLLILINSLLSTHQLESSETKLLFAFWFNQYRIINTCIDQPTVIAFFYSRDFDSRFGIIFLSLYSW